MRIDPLWIRQVRGVLRLELRKNLLSGRALPIYLLGLLPVLGATMFVLVNMAFGTPEDLQGQSGATLFFAIVFQPTLGTLYFGCVWIFMNLFRGEVLDRSLHYYFLAPIRREVLVAGKFISGWATATLVFCSSTVVFYLMLNGFLTGPKFAEFMLRDGGLGQLVGYTGVTALGCLGYGAVFLIAGLFLKNPVVPALVILLWESINFLLPAALKKVSVIFYLQSLLPVPVSEGPFAVMAAPTSPWLAVPGLLIFSAVVLVAAALRIRKMEIAYAD
ncbi:MAG: hypothetical protein GY716_19495 [bacterium]|nr:hypothetical protein [bacterium]